MFPPLDTSKRARGRGERGTMITLPDALPLGSGILEGAVRSQLSFEFTLMTGLIRSKSRQRLISFTAFSRHDVIFFCDLMPLRQLFASSRKKRGNAVCATSTPPSREELSLSKPPFQKNKHSLSKNSTVQYIHTCIYTSTSQPATMTTPHPHDSKNGPPLHPRQRERARQVLLRNGIWEEERAE